MSAARSPSLTFDHARSITFNQSNKLRTTPSSCQKKVRGARSTDSLQSSWSSLPPRLVPPSLIRSAVCSRLHGLGSNERPASRYPAKQPHCERLGPFLDFLLGLWTPVFPMLSLVAHDPRLPHTCSWPLREPLTSSLPCVGPSLRTGPLLRFHSHTPQPRGGASCFFFGWLAPSISSSPPS